MRCFFCVQADVFIMFCVLSEVKGMDIKMKVLVIVDMQNDFIDGALGTKEAAAIVDRVRDKAESAQKDGDYIIYTRDTHQENYLETQEGRNLPVVHCVRGTQGWEISKKVYLQGCEIIDKPTFGSVRLAERIAELTGEKEIEAIELVGLCTDICVISNAMVLKAQMPEMPILVDASCCAGVTVESHKNALKAMEMCQIKVSE